MSLVCVAGPGSRLFLSQSAIFVEPSTRTLEMVWPMASGAAGSGVHASSRCFRAYTGLALELPLCAIFGSFPYTWTLSNAPAGMVVASYTKACGRTGYMLSWPNPDTTASDIVIHCTDREDEEVTQTITVTVGTSGFKFVDSANAAGGRDGSFANPWNSLSEMYAGTTSSATDIVYFKNGTYTPAGISVANADDANGEERINWAGATIWVAYPGHSPVLDFEYAGSGAPYNTGDSVPRIRASSEYLYVDGFEFTRSMTMAFQLNSGNARGQVFWRCTFDTTGPGITGGNSAFLMWVRSPDAPRRSVCVISCSFDGIQYGTGNCALKIYDTRHMLIDGCLFPEDSGGAEAPCAIKGGVEEYCLRDNRFGVSTWLAIGGNMAGNDTDPVELTSGEICYNVVIGSPTETTAGRGCLQINDHSDAFGPTDVYRNTFYGLITLSDIDTGDGPILFRHNVIVNSSGAQTPWNFIVDSAVTDSSVVTLTDNLTGAAADNIVNATTGELEEDYAVDYGPLTATPRGHAYA